MGVTCYSCFGRMHLNILKLPYQCFSKIYSLRNYISQGTNSDYPNLFMYMSLVQCTSTYLCACRHFFIEVGVRVQDRRER